MASLAQRVAYTTQMLGFARVQLLLLKQDLNPFQKRACKHAFLMQTVHGFIAYLEEIDALPARETGQSLPLIGLVNAVSTNLKNIKDDFRASEISLLLQSATYARGDSEPGWLLQLLTLFEASQQATIVERKDQQEEAESANLIIAVATNVSEKYWWDPQAEELERLLSALEQLIARQRESSAEN